MRRSAGCAAAIAVALLVEGAAPAQEHRFDLQTFRPSGTPQDLVMVTQSRPLSHLSVSVGAYLSYMLDPLVLVNRDGGTRKALNIVSSRLQLDVMGAIGLFDWVEFGVAIPLVLFQTGDNLADVGTEGSVQSSAFGDIRLTGKFAIPGLRRRAEGKGFGMALTLQLSLPTGSVDAFAGDGGITFSPGFVLDYRFGMGLLLSINGGVWFRPDGEWSGLTVGDMASFGAGIEVPIVRRWGITVLGEIYGAVSMSKLPDSPRQVPAEGLLGIRWYSSSGFTLTVGAGGGVSCSFGVPTIHFFIELVWVPSRTREWAAIERFKVPPTDPDGDGVIGKADKCPEKAGPVQNHGCPDEDRDKDGVIDRFDKCPDEPARDGVADGCPRVRIQGRKIVILEQVHFATDQDVILPESFPLLEDVARLLDVHPEILRLLVEGHTDIRASDTYNMDLSNRRASSVVRFLISRGVAPSRIHAEGFGRRLPLAPNTTEAGMAQNRRVEFTIEELGSSRPLAGAPDRDHALPGSALPGKEKVLPNADQLPSQVLPSLAPSAPNLPAPSRGKSLLPTVKPGAPQPILQGAEPEPAPIQPAEKSP